MKITKNELKEIIREEATRFKRKIELETELAEVQSQLDEVTGGPGTHVANDSAGVMYDKNIKTKSAPGGPEALVEDGMEEEVEINIDDESVAEESYVSEEALEEILNEIMSEDDDEDEEEPEEEPVEENMMEGEACEEGEVEENMMEGEACEEGEVEENMMEGDDVVFVDDEVKVAENDTKLQGKETAQMKKGKEERDRKLKTLGKTDIYDSAAQEVLDFIPDGQELDIAKLKTAIDKRKKMADAEGDAQPQNESASLVSEEVKRMKQLAGIKIL